MRSVTSKFTLVKVCYRRRHMADMHGILRPQGDIMSQTLYLTSAKPVGTCSTERALKLLSGHLSLFKTPRGGVCFFYGHFRQKLWKSTTPNKKFWTVPWKISLGFGIAETLYFSKVIKFECWSLYLVDNTSNSCSSFVGCWCLESFVGKKTISEN